MFWNLHTLPFAICRSMQMFPSQFMEVWPGSRSQEPDKCSIIGNGTPLGPNNCSFRPGCCILYKSQVGGLLSDARCTTTQYWSLILLWLAALAVAWRLPGLPGQRSRPGIISSILWIVQFTLLGTCIIGKWNPKYPQAPYCAESLFSTFKQEHWHLG